MLVHCRLRWTAVDFVLSVGLMPFFNAALHPLAYEDGPRCAGLAIRRLAAGVAVVNCAARYNRL
jgi:hypothetical protein